MTPAALAALLAAASPTPAQATSAIWGDIRLNVLVGGGIWRNRAWTDGPDPDHPPTLRIARLNCRTSWGVARCRFALLRELDPHSRTPDATPQPPRLRCTARLRRYKQPDGTHLWEVVRTPPFDGLSLSSMRCRALRRLRASA